MAIGEKSPEHCINHNLLAYNHLGNLFPYHLKVSVNFSYLGLKFRRIGLGALLTGAHLFHYCHIFIFGFTIYIFS